MGIITSFFYQVNVTWVRVLVWLVSSRDVKGRENVPRKGPLILASNHMNNADPPVLTPVVPRRVSWLTKAEWFKTPVVGWLFKRAGMIPVRRFEADLGALREAQELLKNGGCLGMFPEGTRSKTAQLQRGEPGSALIALRTGAPIQPAAVWGTENVRLPRDLLRRTHVHVRFGKPFKLERRARITREEVAAGTERIMREIAALLPERYRGVYGESAAKEEHAVESNR